MSIFNNEYKIVVGVSTQKLIKDKYNELRDSALDALINNKSFIENIKQVMGNGLGASVRKYVNITEKSHTDLLGLNVIDYNAWLNFGLQFAEAGYGMNDPIVMKTYAQVKFFFYNYKKMFDLVNSHVPNTHNFRYYWSNRYDPLGYLTNEYMPNFMDWNPVTKELSNYPPEILALGSVIKVEWLGDIQMNMWGPQPRLKVYLNTGVVDYLYSPLNLNNWMDDNKSLLIIRYRNNTSAGILQIPLSELPEEMSTIIKASDYSQMGKYIPTSSVVKSKVPLIEDLVNPKRKPTIEALNVFGISLQEVTDGIMSTASGNDPELVDDAFIGFGVNIRNTSQISIDYMFDFFTYLKQTQGSSNRAYWEDFLNNANNANENYFLNSKYNDIEIIGGDGNNYRHKIRFTWSESTMTNEVIGEVGITTKEVILRDYLDVGGWEVDDSSLILKRQITPTQVITIEVRGLNYVAETYPDAFAYYRLTEYDDEAKNHIYLPLIHGLTEQYGVFERGELFQESLVLTVFAKDVVKIPWYLSEEFLDFVQVVTVVVSLYSLNPQGATYYEFLKQLALEAIKQIIIAKLLEITIKEVANILGYDATAILIALAAIYGAYNYTMTDNVWAEELLKLVQLAHNSFNNIVMDAYDKTMQEMEDFNDKYEEALKAIEEVQSKFAAPIDHLIERRFSFRFDPNETPEMFYNRTVHAGNVGVASLDAVSTFVQRKLTLPKNSDFEPK